MNMLTGQFKAIALSGHDNPISVDFDPEKGQIYWSDVASKVLKRALLNGSDEEVVKLMSASEYCVCVRVCVACVNGCVRARACVCARALAPHESFKDAVQ